MQAFHHITCLHTFLSYGNRLHRAFGRHIAGVARSCIFPVVFCWCLGLVQVVNAEWGTDDRQTLDRIGGFLEHDLSPDLKSVKGSTLSTVSELQKYLPYLSTIHQDILALQLDLGVYSGISISDSLFQIRDCLGVAGSGKNINQYLASILSSVSSIQNTSLDIFNVLGYTGTEKLKTDMSSIVTKLEAIRTALSSSGTTGGITQDQLSSALKSQFGEKIGLSGSSAPKVLAYSVSSSGNWITERFDTGSIPVLFSRLNQQISFLGDFLKYWNGEYLTTKVSNKLDTISDKLNTIISKMGTGSSSGGGGLTSEELGLLFEQYFGIPFKGSGSRFFWNPSSFQTNIGGYSFGSLVNNSAGSPQTLLEALYWLDKIMVYGADVVSTNQRSFAQLFWKALMGGSGNSSSSSDLVRDGFVTYSFGDSPAFYADGKPWRLYTESVFNNPQNLLEALAVINTNLARFTNVQSKNMYALGNQNYWSTTNIVSRIDPNAYWGNSESDLTTLETNKTFQVSVNKGEGGSSSPVKVDYAPVVTNDLTVVQMSINENTNRIYSVKSDEIQARYLRNPFGESSSSDQIDDVSAGASEVLEIGGVTLDFGESYALFKEKFLSTVAPKVKRGFGFFWGFLAVLYSSIAIRKCVTGGV